MSNKFFGTKKSKSAGDDRPMVSVIIAVYNVEAYLRQCLDSVIGQTLRHIEIICVDDGSTDSSLQILKEYQLKDSRIRIIRQAHAGAGAARNKGLQAARGEYLSVLDSDDFFEPDMLKKAYYAAKVEDADIVVFKSDFYDEQEHRFTPCDYSVREDMLPKINPFGAMDIPDRIFNIGCGWAWDKLFRRDFVEENRARFQEIRTSNDMFFVFYLYSKAESIYVMSGLFAHRRINAYNTLSVTREKSWDDFYHALMALKEQLTADGTYDIFRHSFVNWALNFSLWHIDTLDKELSREVKQKCREEYFEKLDILNHDPSYFLYDREYKRLERIMGQAKVSVVIPVYNGERYIRQCLDSVCGQTLQEIQIICVNDGSTDGTADILREYESRDDRITVVDKEHTNAGESRNAGMKLAEGEYISFLDADDFFEPDMLESAYAAIQDAAAQICAFRCDQFDNQTKQFHECPWTLKLEMMPEQRSFSSHDCADNIFTMTSCTAWDKLYRRSFVLENKIEFQSVPSCNDMLFTFSAYVNADKITTLDRILVHQRVNHAKTLSRDIEYLWHNFYDALFALKNYLIDHRIYEEYKRSFVNWAIDFSIWNMYNYRRHFRDLIRQSLKRRFFDDLDITSSPQELFSNQDLYNEMRQIMSEKKERDKNITPKVSIIIPTYNVEQYLRVCLDSAVNQTLEDIEIIIVNDGSTDNSLEIIKEYAAEDDRIVVIDKENGGYGMAMNCGMDRARGEYIGIIEPDDFVDVNMFGDLYNIAAENDLDFIKADFNRFEHDGYGNLVLMYNKIAYNDVNYNLIIKPADAISSFNYIMNTWSGIYKRSFIEENSIRHNETPGASFQDNGFWFQTMMYAKRAMFYNHAYYMNRRDNPNSSVMSSEKVYCMNREYEYIRDLVLNSDLDQKKFLALMNVKKFRNYLFRYETIAGQYQEEYILKMSEEFNEAQVKGELNEDLFRPQEVEKLEWIMKDPQDFYRYNNFDTPDVSVIIPVFNAALYLRECLDSVLNQTLKKIEVICVDDGSEDESLSILREYENADSRVKVFHQNNLGGGAARNKGLDIAKGKYLSFLDADDFFDLKMLREAYNKCERIGADICIYKVRRYDDVTKKYSVDKGSFIESNFPVKASTDIRTFSGKELGSYIFNTFQTWPWNKMFRRKYIDKLGIRFQEIYRTNDLYFVNTALMRCERITVVRLELINYRVGTTNNCQSTNNKAPTDFHKALCALYEEVCKEGNNAFMCSFYNLYVRSCNYNLNSVFEQDADAYAYLYRYLHEEGFEQVDPMKINREIITSENRAAYKECQMVKGMTFEEYMVDKLRYNRNLVQVLKNKAAKTKSK